MPITIEEVVKKIDVWRDKMLDIQEMPGGITNENYRIDVDGRPYFVSIPGASTQFLGVDGSNKHYNTKAASAIGVGPQVLHYLPEHQVMVLEFIHGETMSLATMNNPGMPGRLAQVLLELHTAQRFLIDFNIFRLADFYLDILDEHNWAVPAGYRRRMAVLGHMERAVSSPPFATVSCTNDLVAENIIDIGERLRLIDFDYSGNNDPCFELGNACQELQYNADQCAELCAAYFGAPRRHLLARIHLYAISSDIVWSLWGAIQHEISQLDLDFWSYAIDRWERAQVLLDSTEFPRWLEAAARES